MCRLPTATRLGSRLGPGGGGGGGGGQGRKGREGCRRRESRGS